MSNIKSIIPLGDRILVLPLDDSEGKKSKGGIIIPDTVDKERPQRGKVVAVGEGKQVDDGSILPMRVKKGQIVFFSKYGPSEIMIDEKEYLILSMQDILAVEG
tara:strand:+ start:3822 stop:4130 length:309 start_codon:yes stop_codon:yes gene_type:complete